VVAAGPVRPVGTVERAFQLAPASASVEEVRAKLRREGYAQVDEHLSGGMIRSELKRLLAR
jgi:hypothetical protein